MGCMVRLALRGKVLRCSDETGLDGWFGVVASMVGLALCGKGLQCLDGSSFGLENKGDWRKEILCNRLLGGKRSLSISVKGARFAIVKSRHVPHMFCDLGHLNLPVYLTGSAIPSAGPFLWARCPPCDWSGHGFVRWALLGAREQLSATIERSHR